MFVLNLDNDNRILSIWKQIKGTSYNDMPIVDERPEDIVGEGATEKEKDASNYKYIDGEYVYDPLPEPEPIEPEPTTEYATYDELAAAIREGVNSYGQ